MQLCWFFHSHLVTLRESDRKERTGKKLWPGCRRNWAGSEGGILVTSLSPAAAAAAAAGAGRGAGGPHRYAHLIGRLQLSPHSLKQDGKSQRVQQVIKQQMHSVPSNKAERYDNMYHVISDIHGRNVIYIIVYSSCYFKNISQSRKLNHTLPFKSLGIVRLLTLYFKVSLLHVTCTY